MSKMYASQLISIALFTVAAVFTIYMWMDRWTRTNQKVNEAFIDLNNDPAMQQMLQMNEPIPSDADAVKAHQTLLRYIRNDYGKGVRFVLDFGKRFFGESALIRQDLDVRRLLDNYVSPLQGA
jgi:hypothetical protein